MKYLNNNKIKSSIIESIIVISIMISYIMYGVQVLPLLIPFVPIPFIILGVRNGINSNVISTIIVSLTVAVLIDVPSGASILLILAPLSIAVNYCIKKRKSTMETILISTGAFFISFLLLMFLEGKVTGINLTKQMEEGFMEILSMQIEFFKEMGMTNYQILQRKEYYSSIYKTVIIQIPSLLAILSFLISYINLLVTSLILRGMGIGISNKGRLSKFKLPNNIIPGIGVMLLVGFVFKQLGLGYTDAFLLNIIFLTIFAFFLQGLAVIDFLLIKAKIKRVFRVIIISMNIIFVPVSSILAIIGLLDTIFDLRKIRRSKSL